MTDDRGVAIRDLGDTTIEPVGLSYCHICTSSTQGSQSEEKLWTNFSLVIFSHLIHVEHGDDDVGDEAGVGGHGEQVLTVLDLVRHVAERQNWTQFSLRLVYKHTVQHSVYIQKNINQMSEREMP